MSIEVLETLGNDTLLATMDEAFTRAHGSRENVEYAAKQLRLAFHCFVILWKRGEIK